MSFFQVLRQQPLPMAFALQLIDMASVIQHKLEAFNEMQTKLSAQHLKGETKPSKVAIENLQTALQELLKQNVSLPGRRFPRAVASEIRISADALGTLLWLFEPS